MWIDIASIVFVCVTANHLGLVKAIEGIINLEMRIVNCPKCLSFWATLTYCLVCRHSMTSTLAISFLASYSALWLELFEAFIDKIYMKLYGKITTNCNDDTTAADTISGHSAGSVSYLQQNENYT